MSTHASFGAMLDGAAMSYVLYGIICCQVVWYYGAFARDPLHIKVFVGLVWVAQTTHASIEFASLWYYLLGRGLDVEPLRFTLCTHWSLQAHSIPAEFSSFLVEGYLVLRMWKLSTRKRTAILAFAPFLVGYSFSAVYIIGLFKHQCYPESLANNSIMVVSFSLRLFTDILVTVTMCKMLYRRKSGIQSHMASLRVIRSLIMWSLTTGLLICISSTIFLTTYLILFDTLIYLGVYYVRERVFAITIFAMLNDRDRVRDLKGETISLQIPVTVVDENAPLGIPMLINFTSFLCDLPKKRTITNSTSTGLITNAAYWPTQVL